MRALVPQDVVDPGALGAAQLVHALLKMDQPKQAPALDVAGAALVPGVSVLVLHRLVTVSTTPPARKRTAA
jgi:hypothetical protein